MSRLQTAVLAVTSVPASIQTTKLRKIVRELREIPKYQTDVIRTPGLLGDAFRNKL